MSYLMSLMFFVENIIYFTCILLFEVNLFNSKLIFRNVFIGIIPITILTFVYQIIYNTSYFFLLPFLCLFQLISFVLIFSELKKSRCFFIYIMGLLTNMEIVSILGFLLPDSGKMVVEYTVHFIYLLFCLICCFTKIKTRLQNAISLIGKKIKIMISVVLVSNIFLTFCVLMVFKYEKVMNSFEFRVTVFISLLLFFATTTYLFPFLISTSVSNIYFKKLANEYEEQIKAQAEHYSALSKANFELRRFKHDLNNIRIGVSKLVAEGNYDMAVKMLDNTNENIYDTANELLKFDTGNGIVDALLADKQNKALVANTGILFDGAVPPDGISATELCVLFGNTVDNAIEACNKITENIQKNIDIVCKCRSGFMFLDITNPVNEDVEISNNVVRTTKEDNSKHGFGLYSLNKIVKNHDGEIKLSCENKVFKVSIIMSIH